MQSHGPPKSEQSHRIGRTRKKSTQQPPAPTKMVDQNPNLKGAQSEVIRAI